MPMKNKSWGEWAFILGVLLAIVTGLITSILSAGTVGLVLVVLGLIVGFLNVQEKETVKFLVAAIALMLTGLANVNQLPVVGPYLDPVLKNIVIFVAPAALVVSLKAIVDLTKK